MSGPRYPDDVHDFVGAGAPTDGAGGTFAGGAGKGSTYADTDTGRLYVNIGDKESATWVAVDSHAGGGGGGFDPETPVDGITFDPQATDPDVPAVGALYFMDTNGALRRLDADEETFLLLRAGTLEEATSSQGRLRLDTTLATLQLGDETRVEVLNGRIKVYAHDAVAEAGHLDIQLGPGGRMSIGDLPTANPGVAGDLWSDGGVLKISSGP